VSLPQRFTVLAVQADEAAHAPVRAALKAIDGADYEVHWVTTPRAAIAALDEHPHDAFLVDRELHDAGHSGLDVARDILAHTQYAPVILLDDAADRETDVSVLYKGRTRTVRVGAASAPGASTRVQAARALLQAHTALVARRPMAEDDSTGGRPGADFTVVGVPDLQELLT